MISIKKKRNRVYDDLIFSMYSFVACATNLFNIISIKIKEIEKKYQELSENPISDIPIKYQFLQQKIQEISKF